jgi:hypothetical protein
LKLDFEDDEISFRKEIWLERIRRLITVWSAPTEGEPTERICSETLKVWLEEGQELEMVTNA